MTYDELINKIRTGERFDFSRFGDGEFNAIYRDQKSVQNCDGHMYFDDMGDRLLEILKSNPEYYIALQSLAHRQRTKQIDSLTDVYGLSWCEANILHRANIKGRLPELFEVLSDRDVLLVGPVHLKELAEREDWYYLNVPVKNCWLHYKEIKAELTALIPVKDWVFLYCASMMANVLIDDFSGRVTQIDAGSIFDPHVGVKSRRYHHDLKIKA